MKQKRYLPKTTSKNAFTNTFSQAYVICISKYANYVSHVILF